MKERIQTLLKSLNCNIYEKESELSLSLLAAIAGESIILLGPPGVAKSMIGHKLKVPLRMPRHLNILCHDSQLLMRYSVL